MQNSITIKLTEIFLNETQVMQRFYEAVELDEAEMARKRSCSVEPTTKNTLKSVEKMRDSKEMVCASAIDNKLVNKIRIFMRI